TTIANQTVEQGQTLTFAAQATDADATQELTFSLAAGAPVGAAINGQTGVFTWTPTLVQGPGTFVMTIVVQDNGTPPASAERTFPVAVTESAVAGKQLPRSTTIANQTVEQGQTLTF